MHLISSQFFLTILSFWFIVPKVQGVPKGNDAMNLKSEALTEESLCGTLPDEKEVLDPHTRVPWTAVVYLQTESQPDQTHGAVILSPTMVLLGANKFLSEGDKKKLKLFPPSNYQVRTNTTLFSDTSGSFMQFSQVTHIRIHPSYIGLSKTDVAWQTTQNDFALVHLKNPIIFDSQNQPPCIPTVNQLSQILTNWVKNGTGEVLLTGWKRHMNEGIVLRMAPNDQTICRRFWIGESETRYAAYTDRICANVSSINSHINCIHSGVSVVTKLETRFYLTALVNNFYSDNRTCTSKARYFLSHLTPQLLTWIKQNEKCGPQQFTCDDGQCIPLAKNLCNRIPDCADGSDENPFVCRGYNYCNVNDFGCGAYGKCINATLVCDGKPDCEEGEDELKCHSPEPEQPASSKLLLSLLGISLVVILLVAVVAAVFWKKMKVAEQKLRDLTDEEVAEFEQGLLDSSSTNEERQNHRASRVYTNCPPKVSNLQPTAFAWDGARFEIPKDQLLIDWEKSLGSGISGVVYHGLFEEKRSQNASKVSHPVAVKTFKSSSDVESFKALLSELKIMSRVGSHDNVVGLIGAYTREIKQRVIYIAVELCGMGDLEGFLKKNRNSFANVSRHDGPNRAYEQSVWQDRYKNREILDGSKMEFTLDELVRWSYEIANGMEYLASLNITHGDLATRNVLLTDHSTVKISDFGLARNLYESGVYVKKNTAPLPWRWMAVESLRDFEFSTRSDVWAYGVTLWEIYALGGIPFPGLGWTTEFVTNLYQGLRMGKPTFATPQIYEVMLNCWETEPNRRPTFTALKHFFKNLQENGFGPNEVTTAL